MRMNLIDPDDTITLGVPNYSHGIHVDGAERWVQLSGQVGVAPDGTVYPGFEPQCRQAFQNIRACLRDAEMGFDDVVMLRIFLIDREDLESLRKIRAEFFGARRFPSTLVFVSGLVNPAWKVELEVTAAAGEQEPG